MTPEWRIKRGARREGVHKDKGSLRGNAALQPSCQQFGQQNPRHTRSEQLTLTPHSVFIQFLLNPHRPITRPRRRRRRCTVFYHNRCITSKSALPRHFFRSGCAITRCWQVGAEERRGDERRAEGDEDGVAGSLAGCEPGYGWSPCACAVPVALACAQVLRSSAAAFLLGLASHRCRCCGFRCALVRCPVVQAASALRSPLPGRRLRRLVLQFGGSIDWTSDCGGCVLPLAEHETVQACLTREETAQKNGAQR